MSKLGLPGAGDDSAGYQAGDAGATTYATGPLLFAAPGASATLNYDYVPLVQQQLERCRKSFEEPELYRQPDGHTPGTSLSGPISTILTPLSWIFAGVYMCGALLSPVCA